MSLPQLCLLGGYDLRSASGSPVEVPTKKARALLAYLALHKRAVPRDKLAGLLWGDCDDKRAFANLRQTLFVLRRALDEAAPLLLSSSRDAVALDPARIEVDVLRFEQLASGPCAGDLEAAVALYQGDLAVGGEIHDPAFELWEEEERRRLRDRMRKALFALAQSKREAAEPEAALTATQRLVVMEPLDERAHRLAMALYGQLGQREAALRQYERCRQLLEDELGVAPEPETEAALQALCTGGASPAERTAVPQSAASEQTGGEPAATDGPSPILPRIAGRFTSWQWTAVGAFALAVVAAGVALLGVRAWQPELEPASLERMAYPLPDKPSIAVLPFDNLSGDPSRDYFTDGFTDDLITDLSKLDDLFVISRNSTFVYKGRNVPVREVAEDLGVRYVLEGSIRENDGQVRINVQLVDATSGVHVWAERYERPMTDIFAVHDELTRRVVMALAGQLTVERLLRDARRETHSLAAYDAFLHALKYMHTYTRESLAIAIQYLEQALALDPDYPRVHAALGGLYWDIANEGWETSFGLTYDEAFTNAKHHLKEAMRVPSPLAHFYISKSHSNEGRYEEAIAEARKMIALNPNDSLGYRALGRALNKAGRSSESIATIRMAMRLDPRGDDTGWVSYRLGEALYLSSHFEEAAEAFARSAERNQNEWSYVFLAASYGQLNRLDEASEALATFNRIKAEAGEELYTVAKVEGWVFKNEEDRARVQDGFRKAGMPEGATSDLKLNWAQDVSPSEVEGATTIDAVAAKSLFDLGTTFVDVRGDHYWNAGHVPGAVHLSLYSDFTPLNLAEVADKDQPLVILAHGDAGGTRSARAAARAVSWGFTKVHYFREGFPAWHSAGYPVENASE